ILGVKESQSDAEIKKAYRKLMARHHPDKLASKGLPEEVMKEAQARAQDIQAAYDTIKQKRGMR
ncbi:MAG TPA: molecular chaperone DjlA, partial [Idiomarina sp.]|nr:molecular chaperone DjlA [Idiomarina sp.]